MQLGLFGKLPTRGDFITRAIPAEVLQHWEQWLERVMPGARSDLAANWDHAWAQAPAWRFWIGEGVFGHALAGVMVTSQDKVGRRFPLTVMLIGAGARHPAPPLSDPHAAWFTAIEDALCAARDGGGAGDDPAALLAALPLPQAPPAAQAQDRARAFFAYGEHGLDRLLHDVRDHDHQLAATSRSYWWTAGNRAVPPAFLALDGMPDATGFAGLLTGFGAPAPVAAPTPGPDQPADWDDIPEADLAWAAPAPPTAEDAPAPAGLDLNYRVKYKIANYTEQIHKNIKIV